MHYSYSCEIEDFVEPHLRKLCLIRRSRVSRGVYVLVKDIGRRLPLVLASTRVNKVVPRRSAFERFCPLDLCQLSRHPPTTIVDFPSVFSSADPCSVKDALAVESQVNVVRDACLRHFGQGGVDKGDGLTAAQFQAACLDLAEEKDFENFRELAEDRGLSEAVYSR